MDAQSQTKNKKIVNKSFVQKGEFLVSTWIQPEMDCNESSWSGRVLQALGLATAKSGSPKVKWRVAGTTRFAKDASADDAVVWCSRPDKWHFSGSRSKQTCIHVGVLVHTTCTGCAEASAASDGLQVVEYRGHSGVHQRW